jgi:hypothetical protein
MEEAITKEKAEKEAEKAEKERLERELVKDDQRHVLRLKC